MKHNSPKDIYHIYELEAMDFVTKSSLKNNFFKKTFQASGVFISMTLVVFLIINFRFIVSQISDWNSDKELSVVKIFSEKNGENLAIEDFNGRNFFSDFEKKDSDKNGKNDLEEFLQGEDPFSDEFLRAEISFNKSAPIPIYWKKKTEKENNFAFLLDPQKIIFNNTLIVPVDFIGNYNDQAINELRIYLKDKEIKFLYREIARETFSNFSDAEFLKDNNFCLVSGWPQGTDWQKILVKMELVEIINN